MGEEKIKHEYNNCTFNYNYAANLLPVPVVSQQNKQQNNEEFQKELLAFIKSKIDIKLSDELITEILNAEDEFYGK